MARTTKKGLLREALSRAMGKAHGSENFGKAEYFRGQKDGVITAMKIMGFDASIEEIKKKFP